MAFGRADVDAFLAELGPRQFDEWRTFYALQPWGPERSDLRIGLLAAALQTMAGVDLGWKPEDFLLSPIDRWDSSQLIDAGWEDTEVQAAKLRQLGRLWEAAH